MKLNPETLARASSRHPGRTVAIWAVILVLGFGASGALLSGSLTTDFDFSNNPRAKQAKTILVCTKCLKSGAVTKRVKAAPFRLPPQPAAAK